MQCKAYHNDQDRYLLGWVHKWSSHVLTFFSANCGTISEVQLYTKLELGQSLITSPLTPPPTLATSSLPASEGAPSRSQCAQMSRKPEWQNEFQTIIDIICTTSDSTPLSSITWMVSLNVVFLTTSTTASILAFLALLAGSFLRLRVGLCKIYCNFSKNHLQKIIIFVNCRDGDDLGMEMMKIPWRLQLQRRRLPPSCLRDCGIDQLPCVFLFILIMKTFLCVKSWRWRRIAPSLRRLPWPCQRRSNGRGLQNRPGRGRWRKGD